MIFRSIQTSPGHARSKFFFVDVVFSYSPSEEISFGGDPAKFGQRKKIMDKL